MTKLQAAFIKNLRQERERLGYSQEKMAEKSGITHKYYGAIELGYKFPSLEKLEGITGALGIPAYRLFIDAPAIEGMPSAEVVDRYNDFLKERFQNDLPKARADFLQELESKM